MSGISPTRIFSDQPERYYIKALSFALKPVYLEILHPNSIRWTPFPEHITYHTYDEIMTVWKRVLTLKQHDEITFGSARICRESDNSVKTDSLPEPNQIEFVVSGKDFEGNLMKSQQCNKTELQAVITIFLADTSLDSISFDCLN